MSDTIIRIVHNKENPFVQLNKKALWDERLSLKAIGLWARCLSRPNDWRFNVTELVQKSKEGRKAIDSAIHELIRLDYAIRIEWWEQGEDGKFGNKGMEYVFFEFPATQEDKDKILEEFKKFHRDCRFGNFRNGELLNTDSNQERKDPPISPKGGLPSSRKKTKEEPQEVAPGVFVTPTQKADLLRRANQNPEKLLAFFDKLSSWKIGKGMIGGQDYRMILKWVIKAVETEESKPKKIDRVEADKLLAEKVKSYYSDSRDIELGYNYIEFRMGRMGIPDPHIKFGENGFEEQVINNLRKMGLISGNKIPF